MEVSIDVDDVRHIAQLARLRLTDSDVNSMVHDLGSIVSHLGRLCELNVNGVAPLAHPLPIVNRLDADDPSPSLPIETVMRNAPAVEGPFFAVPKILAEDGSS